MAFFGDPTDTMPSIPRMPKCPGCGRAHSGVYSESCKGFTAAPVLTTDAKLRKDTPVTTGVLDYFPLAIIEIARLSKAGNDQHNPGEPLHWAKEKSTDHADCIVRHLLERGTMDTDGMRHSAKVAWRALAMLQIELENEQK